MWVDLFGHLQADFGYTPTEIREMTLHDVRRLGRYMAGSPSARQLLRLLCAAQGIDLSAFNAPAAAAGGNSPYSGEPGQSSPYLTGPEFLRMVQDTGGRIPGLGPAR